MSLFDDWEIHCKDCKHIHRLKDRSYDAHFIRRMFCMTCGSGRIRVRSEQDNVILRDYDDLTTPKG